MTNAAIIAGLTGGAAPSPVAALNASSSSNAGLSSSNTASSGIVRPTTPALSPRVTFDPAAGEIIQYLNDTGQVQSQIPSTTVVAYLKAGLTNEGLIKKPDTTEA